MVEVVACVIFIAMVASTENDLLRANVAIAIRLPYSEPLGTALILVWGVRRDDIATQRWTLHT